LAFLLLQTGLEQVQAQDTPFLTLPHHYFLDLSIPYSLPVLRGMRVYPAKPFEFDVVVDSRDRHTLDQKETSLLIKYFLTCLTVPEQDLWVNLSPYEHGRIIPNELSLTDAGNTLLEQDKMLKELASSLTYPDAHLGKKFWEQIYKKAYEKFGITNLPLNTYNKVWIVPDKAIVYDMGDSALIGETHLKVMLEEDYVALKRHSEAASPIKTFGVKLRATEESKGALRSFAGAQDDKSYSIAAQITREIILPTLEKEINDGKNFAPVRQVFHSMILAAWFKRVLKRNILSSVYVNKKKISGVDDVSKDAKEQIYKQYLRMYKVGAYNFIREDIDPVSQQVVPRKYFSGGLSFGSINGILHLLRTPGYETALRLYFSAAEAARSAYALAKVELTPIGGQKIWDQLMEKIRASANVFSLNNVTRLAAGVAIAVTISVVSGAMAQAASVKPLDAEHVTVVPYKGENLGVMVKQLYGADNLWKAKLPKAAEIYKDQIPNRDLVYAGKKYIMLKKEAFENAGPETRGAPAAAARPNHRE
jgi:hypothetical protein